METNRKKALRESYKNYRPEMGVFGIRHRDSRKIYLMATNNLKGKMNSVMFQLKNHSFVTCRALNEAFKQEGEAAFEAEVLEKLDYDKDDEAGQKDYSQELELMKDLWRDKLLAQGFEVY
ncbi:MAG: GIY-YIG nuclease family protein [Eubacterium sp.]|nr:GIY-YIG nuclease family protein [Eubacterium sp.]